MQASPKAPTFGACKVGEACTPETEALWLFAALVCLAAVFVNGFLDLWPPKP